eukprot:CAMPEP_0170593054 /NCGR_PEP_ID=MMETSP0224-20130122/13243_1 /TAXON_ID=285029 /ORGANISM="Togula jolla, Strain CCCM 725" /LENGTH=196 /DNA_ID=CAMNT_0010916981 /DNA_START=158 /DNA_END=750 /DNA_ORIENTATION=+
MTPHVGQAESEAGSKCGSGSRPNPERSLSEPVHAERPTQQVAYSPLVAAPPPSSELRHPPCYPNSGAHLSKEHRRIVGSNVVWCTVGMTPAQLIPLNGLYHPDAVFIAAHDVAARQGLRALHVENEVLLEHDTAGAEIRDWRVIEGATYSPLDAFLKATGAKAVHTPLITEAPMRLALPKLPEADIALPTLRDHHV